MAFHALALFLTFALFSPCLITADITKLRFPYISEKDGFPRVRIETSFSSLSSFTLCQWLKPNHGREMVSFSYGVPGQDNEIFLSLGGSSTIHFYVGGTPLLDKHCDGQTPVYWTTGAWHYVCVIWSNTRSSIKSYVNGVFCSKSNSEYSDHRIPGNGVMVLGQALKGLDTDFHKNKSWSGDIAGVQMWDEVLTHQQILYHGRCKGKVEGNVVTWMKTPMAASDGVVFSSAEVCDVLRKADD